MRRRAVVCLLGAAGLWAMAGIGASAHAASGAAAAAGSAEFSIVDEPDDSTDVGGGATAGARMSAAQAERAALTDTQLRSVQSTRPDAQLVLRYDPALHRWSARLRERDVVADLARIDIDDRTGRIVARTFLPVGQYPSRLSQRAAIDVAVQDATARREAREWGGMAKLRARARLVECCWEIDLVTTRASDDAALGETVIRVDIVDSTGDVTGVWTGDQIAWKMARGNRMAFGGEANRHWLWLPLFVLFTLVAIDWTRFRSAFTLDVVAVLGIGLSHEFFLRGDLAWSVPLALPPLLWLLGRMVWLFAHGLPPRRPVREPRSRFGRLALRRVPTWAIIVLVVALLGVRAGVAYDGGNVIDVGYAGVAGARLELDGNAPWGNMPEDNQRGDTYGPANYLAYVPATALLDDAERDVWGTKLAAARITAIVADLLCALLLFWIGWRWLSLRAGALAAAGWVACPWTAWALASSVNDAIVAVPLLAAFALLPRATWRGAFVGLAALVKFAPLVVLAPLLHAGARDRRSQAIRTVLGAAMVIGLGLGWVVFRLPAGPLDDLHVFYERTIAFQAERGSPFSPWGLYDLRGSQRMMQVLVIVGLLVACLRPRQRDAWQVAAGVAAALIAVQLVVTHWFYLYIPWFVGFVVLVLVAARERPGAQVAAGSSHCAESGPQFPSESLPRT